MRDQVAATLDMIKSSKNGLQVSMFSIPDEIKAALTRVSAMSVMAGPKKSINTCILEALESYLSIPEGDQQNPELPKLPLRHYTVRMNEDTKQKLTRTAAAWQIRTGVPVTMNAVVNTAILIYLQKHLPDFELPLGN